jgi:hypothetical protein
MISIIGVFRVIKLITLIMIIRLTMVIRNIKINGFLSLIDLLWL